MSKIIGNKAQIPNPALKSLEKLVGVWKTEGSHGLLPGEKLYGKTSFEWIENGAFLLMRSEITDDLRFPSGIAIFGSDDVQQKISMLYFDERAVSRIIEVSAENNTVKWWHNQSGFSQRSTITIAGNGKTMISKGEICKDEEHWEKDMDLIFTKLT